ncbi:MAG: primosomal protein N', partial [Salinibacterium sp.]|nr:primosomal protein N' [Salinibacterium sp.]
EDLGRAFPGVLVLVADGERQLLQVGDEPALVIATRGAEPVAKGGYAAVLLLDGEGMLARESLRVGEDCLRAWSNAAALASPAASIVLVGVGGALATALTTWKQADYARAELSDRRRLRFPPAVRVATVTGTPERVAEATIAAVEAGAAHALDVLGPVVLPDGSVRSIVRFDYASGTTVAAQLRAEVIRAATGRRPPRPTAANQGRRPLLLRVRFDDSEPFLEV